MPLEKRKFKRKSFIRTCWLGPDPVREALILDISKGGARISVPDTRQLPQDLVLYLTPDRKVGRPCRVAWRTRQGAIGVQFSDDR